MLSRALRSAKIVGRRTLAQRRSPSQWRGVLAHRPYVTFQVQNDYIATWTTDDSLRAWINDRIQLLQPARVHLCDGSEEEYESLIRKQVQTGTLVALNPSLRPGSYLARSSVGDVARVEERTFICSESKMEAGPTNNWEDPVVMHRRMEELFNGSMKGRTLYVIPFCMGPLDSEFAQIGVQLTDSPYVVCSMRTMTRMGVEVLHALEESDRMWTPCVHTVGMPMTSSTMEDSSWPCNNESKYIVHFPSERRIWSYGSGYGGNAILGKKCLALRLASVMAREEGWLAEHMLIIGVTNPAGVKKYFLGCFPSACGKTNLAMLQSTLPGWKVETIGDDIAWIRRGSDGCLYALNPEYGFFGVVPGTSYSTNPAAMDTIRSNTIFTNVGQTFNGDAYWESMDTRDGRRVDPFSEESGGGVLAWTRQEMSPNHAGAAAHDNSRFCVPISQCPVLDPDWENPRGVPISGILFGGRRSTTVPLVYEAFDWEHAVFMGSVMGSETTAAAAGLRGLLRIDPFSMRPFCGYNMGDYFQHWLDFGSGRRSFTSSLDDGTLAAKAKNPKVFGVNWFRKDQKGKFLWPGFGENIRVIKWIFERCDVPDSDVSAGNAELSPIGLIPTPDAIDLTSKSAATIIDGLSKERLFKVSAREWLKECDTYTDFYKQFGDRIPNELRGQMDALKARCTAALESDNTKFH